MFCFPSVLSLFPPVLFEEYTDRSCAVLERIAGFPLLTGFLLPFFFGLAVSRSLPLEPPPHSEGVNTSDVLLVTFGSSFLSCGACPPNFAPHLRAAADGLFSGVPLFFFVLRALNL